MRILILDEWVPYPLDTGKKIRTFNLLRHIQALGDVTYVCYENVEAAKQLSSVLPGIRFVHVPDNRTRKGSLSYFLRVAGNTCKRLPFSADYADTMEVRSVLEELLKGHRFDLLVCEWTPYAHLLANYEHPFKVLSTHNIEYLQWYRLRDVTGNPLVGLVASLQGSKMRCYETDMFRRFSLVSVVSHEDRRLLKEIAPVTPCIVVENGVDLNHFRSDGDFARSLRAVFSASMDAFSNEDAAVFYAEEIHPLVRDEVPQAEFMILGRNPSERVRRLASVQGVAVTGTVDDVRPFLRSSGVSVVPLRVGGGTRLKILEAMAVGLPVVSTSIGAEGLAVTDGEHLYLADSPKEFAARVVRCFRYCDDVRRIAQTATTLVQKRYSWDTIGEAMVAELRSYAPAS